MDRRQARLMHALSVTVVAIALASAATATFAVDSSTPAVPYSAQQAANDPLGAARALIAQDKWVAAIDELKRVNATGNADWNNLMGYSHRKAKTPDLAAAERYYDAALAIDAKHRGALEYSGELFLQLGDLARAEQRLAALDKACFMPCAEHTKLKAAVASFKAGGNKVVAKP